MTNCIGKWLGATAVLRLNIVTMLFVLRISNYRFLRQLCHMHVLVQDSITIQSTSPDGLWTFFSKNKFKQGPAILYNIIVGKIFLQGVSFDSVYNESVHENMKIKIENLFFSHKVHKKNIIFFLKQRWRCIKQQSHHTHISLSNRNL